MMIPTEDDRVDALRSALRIARENEKRWLAMSLELSSDAEQAEQWRSTAGLRRHEVERLEALLAESAGPPGWPHSEARPKAGTQDVGEFSAPARARK